MEGFYSVKLSQLVEEMKLEVLRASSDYDEICISTEDVNRCGLQLTGFYEHFDERRMQIIGLVEQSYLSGLTSEERKSCFEQLFSWEIPALAISRNMECFPECMELAEQYDRTILRSPVTTTALLGEMITRLRDWLAPRITRHGVLVEVYGEGVLLLGESGVGKSETAIELVKRGHRLIADDAVEIKRLGENRLVGTAPALIRHYIELRGIGVIDVRRLFGMSAIKLSQDIHLLINLEQWQEEVTYDRLGLEEFYTNILGVKVPSITVPVKPGRNLAVIVEVAAMNNRHKKMGYNAAAEFAKQINEHFDQSLKEEQKSPCPEEDQ
ncbi:MAG: HPr(Ser) kinase/phosphatase [Oscillospiraceae bacterium]|nr:HPr(Ser) kinase/phosphatase [Oscillospiraceae bacterium]